MQQPCSNSKLITELRKRGYVIVEKILASQNKTSTPIRVNYIQPITNTRFSPTLRYTT